MPTSAAAIPSALVFFILTRQNSPYIRVRGLVRSHANVSHREAVARMQPSCFSELRMLSGLSDIADV